MSAAWPTWTVDAARPRAVPVRIPNDRLPIEFAFITNTRCTRLRNPALGILRRLSQSCGKLKRAAERRWRDTNYAAEDLRKMARAGVAHFEREVDEATD